MIKELNKLLEEFQRKDEYAMRVTEIPKFFEKIKKQLDKVTDLPEDLFKIDMIQKDIDKVKQELDKIWQKFKSGKYER